MKPMTAAEYAAHTEKVRAGKERTEVLTNPETGSIMELRELDLGELVLLGVIPQNLVSESLKALQQRGAYKPTEAVELRVDGLVMKREVVARAAKMPPFNLQTANDWLIEDFNFAYDWAMSHQGEQADALKKMGKGRKRGTSRSRPNGKELQPTSESTATN